MTRTPEEPEGHEKRETDTRLNRLGEAVEVFLEYRSRGGGDDESFLVENEAMRDLLEPMLAEVAAEPEDQAQTDVTSTEIKVIGDFRLLREVGRGGMGVVYEAEQVSLKRRVALKILPQALTISARQIERFRREAAAAAKLHHKAIVPVYSVGEEDGTHYFAMEFVDGPSLYDQIEQARKQRGEQHGGKNSGKDGDRNDSVHLGVVSGVSQSAEVAELVAQVAEGLAEAHANGVIHRDVKPQNILIAKGGQACLVDFGLAKDLDRATISRTTDLAGTPQYMSPEQVATLKQVDARSDVYSLGVVLYECLSLRCPFDGDTTQKVLHAIATQEPRSLRKVNPRVPADLETICHKAMEKEPRDRYQTASEMAADLRRFLNHEPILAQPPGPITLISKFTRRNRAVAALIALAALLPVALVVGYFVHLELSNRALAEEKKETKKANVALQAEKVETARQRDRARQNLRQAQEVLAQQLKRVNELTFEPRMERLYRRMAEDALKYLEQLLSNETQDGTLRLHAASTFGQVATAYARIGESKKALVYVNRSIEMFRALRKDYPKDIHTRADMALALTVRSSLRFGRGWVAKARADVMEAMSLWAGLTAAIAGDSERRNNLLANLALAEVNAAWHYLDLRETAAAESALKRAAALFGQLPKDYDKSAMPAGQVMMKMAEGGIAKAHGQLANAATHYEDAIKMHRKLLAKHPKNASMKRGLAQAIRYRGEVDQMSKDIGAAIQRYEASRKILIELTRDFPLSPNYRLDLARVTRVLGNLHGVQKRLDLAEEMARESLKMAKTLPSGADAPLNHRDVLGRSHALLAHVLHARGGDAAEIRPLFEQAKKIQTAVVKTMPEAVVFRNQLAITLHHYAVFVCRQDRDYKAGLAMAREAIGHQSAVLKRQFDHQLHRTLMRELWKLLAKIGRMVNDSAAIADAGRGILAMKPNDGQTLAIAAQHLARSTVVLEADSSVPIEERPGLIKSYGDEAMVLLEKALERGMRESVALQRLDDFRLLRQRKDFLDLLKRMQKLEGRR